MSDGNFRETIEEDLYEHQSRPTGELMDHEYDGIQEYDNPTPGWWHVLFLGSIVFSFVYVLFWHFSPLGWSVWDAHEAAQTAAFQRVFGKVGDLDDDADTMLSLAQDEEGWMAIAGGIFTSQCASCHGQDGAGLVGPNLTDDHYKNLASIEEIPKVIREGAANGAMPAWQNRLHPNEVVLVSAYVASLRGKNLSGPRGLEGEPIAPWPDAPETPVVKSAAELSADDES